MRIQEASKMLGISTSALRLWEKQGLIVIQRTVLGHRCFSESDLLRIKNVIDQKQASSFGRKG